MALILKQESNAAVTTPPAGSGSVFLNGSDQLTVKDSDGNISTIPTFTATGNAQIFYNNAGALGLSPNLTFDNTTNTLGVTTANVNTLNFGSGSVTGTGNITTGNLIGTIAAGSNTITTTGNITGGNLIGPVAAGSNTITTTGNANVGNLGFGTGVITGTGNITAGNIIGTIAAGSNTISTTGNANVGNIGAATAIFTTGNITTVNSGLVQNGTSNVTIAASGNVSTFINGNTTPQLLVSSGGANIPGYANIVGNLNSGNASLGNLATANFFSGNGNLLTSLTGANVTGAVAYATTANAVAGANVSGAVSYATTANAVAGANVSGAVSYATTANAVAGANVSGAVSYATTANSVAGANVTGDVTGANHANVADSANAVAGANVSGAVAYATTANAVAGANVSGQVANALVAGTIYTNAQPNITSVGTLTSLDVSGTITAANITANTGVFTGNGNGLSSLVGANVTGTVANATYALSAGTAGTVTTNAQPNITSVGTLTSVSVSGNVNSSIMVNGGTGLYLASGPSGYINFFTTGGDKASITDTGNIAASNLIANSTVFAGTANVTGNVNAGNVYANSGTIGASLLTGTLTTTAQPNITSVGTLTSLGVSGTITAANITANSGVITGNGNGLSSLVGANVTGTVANATYALSAGTAGTVTTNAQPNITSVGTLTSLAVTGNITNGNITGGNLVSASFVAGTLTTAAQPNITSTGTLTSLSVTGNVTGGNLVTAGVLSVTGTGVSSIGGNLDMTSNNIINLATPVNSTDAATKQYVDDVAQGLNIHDSCNAATTGTLATISGGTVTYDNGASGVGATLTTTGSYTTMDGVTLTDGMRILVKNEVTAANNGIYVRTSSTVLTRAADFNSVPEIEAGDFTFVTAGTLYDNTGWVQTSTVVTVGTDPIDWTQFSGAGTYTAGTGLTLTGSVFSINVAQPTITSVGTLTSLSVSGNGSFGNVSATTFTGALTGAATTAGTVTTNAQPNITSVGTLTSLGVSGTITAANITANTGVFTGNGNGLSSIVGANVTGTVPSATSATNAAALLQNTSTSTTVYPTFSTSSANGNSSAVINTSISANLGNASITATTFVGALSGAATSATTAGTVTTAAQGNITSVGTLTSLGVNGTVTAVAVTANTGVFTGNANGLSSLQGTNVTGTLNSTTLGNSTVYIGTTGIALNRASASQSLTGITSIDGYAATVSGAAQGNITSVGTLTSLSVTGNVSAGNVNAGNLLTANYSTAVITTAAQPNITSVGTLTSLAVTGNATMANVVASTYDITGVATGISAAGTTQAGGTVLAKAINVVSTVLSGNGVVLPVAVAGMRITVMNTSANSLAVYPAATGIINAQAANAAYTQVAGARLDFVSVSATQWYTLNATYG